MNLNKVISEFKKYGKRLLLEELVHSTSGNMSLKVEDKVYITSHGSCLYDLSRKDISIISLFCKEIPDKCSYDTLLHLEIYRSVPETKTIIHAHPTYTTVLGYIFKDFINPVDLEGKYYIPSCPVVEVKNPVNIKEVAKIVPKFFKKYKIVLVKTHGVYAIGENFNESFNYISVLENCSKIIYHKILVTKK